MTWALHAVPTSSRVDCLTHLACACLMWQLRCDLAISIIGQRWNQKKLLDTITLEFGCSMNGQNCNVWMKIIIENWNQKKPLPLQISGMGVLYCVWYAQVIEQPNFNVMISSGFFWFHRWLPFNVISFPIAYRVRLGVLVVIEWPHGCLEHCMPTSPEKQGTWKAIGRHPQSNRSKMGCLEFSHA